MFGILSKRLLRNKGFWVVLLLTALACAVIGRLEKTTDTVVYAAFSTQDEKLAALLLDYDGLVRFIRLEDEETLKRYIIQNKAECGYVLTERLQQDIVEGKGNWSVILYERGDSTLVGMINEVLFERLHFQISSDWFAAYLAESPFMIAGEGVPSEGQNLWSKLPIEQRKEAVKKALTDTLESGAVFTFERQWLQRGEEGYGRGNASDSAPEDAAEEKPVFFPYRLIFAAELFGCLAIGLFGAVEDRKKGRFRKNALKALFYTILLPPLAGTAAWGAGMLFLAVLTR